MITENILTQCLISLGVNGINAVNVSKHLLPVCILNEITTAKRMSCLLGQLMVESHKFEFSSESLYYRSTKTMVAAFGSRMASRTDLIKDERKMANAAYSNRLGNGDVASDDGWRYRGSGWIQTTGRSNFSALAHSIGIDVVANPERLRTDFSVMAQAAVFHFCKTGCVAFADAGQISNITRAVNGPKMLQAAERAAYTDKAKAFLLLNAS